MADLTLRLTDADRESAAQALGEHYAFGRLDLDEYHQRLDQVHAARTGTDLVAPFADLPRPAVLVPVAERPALPERGSDVWRRLAAASGAFSTLLFLVCGFAFDGWAWSWLFFLLPGALATMSGHEAEPEPAALPQGGEQR